MALEVGADDLGEEICRLCQDCVRDGPQDPSQVQSFYSPVVEPAGLAPLGLGLGQLPPNLDWLSPRSIERRRLSPTFKLNSS